MSNKQIIIPVEELNSSGGLRIIIEIANLFANNNLDVSIIYPEFASKSNFKIDSHVKRKVIPLKKNNILNKFIYLGYLFLFSAKKGDIFIASTYRSVIYIYISKILNLKFSSKIIHLIQGLDIISLIQKVNSNLISKYINSNLYNISNKIFKHNIAVSNHIKDNIKDCHIVINNFVDTNFFYPNNKISSIKNNFTIGTVSHSAPNKGFDFFLECSNELINNSKTKNFEINFLCATQDEVLINKYSNYIKFIKTNSDLEMNKFYNQCDIFFLTSHSEGFGLPALEAMACGCFVVSTDCGGVSDFLTNNHNGIIMNSRDKNLFLQIVLNIFKNPSKALKLKQTGINIAKNQFNKDIFDNAYLSYIKNKIN